MLLLSLAALATQIGYPPPTNDAWWDANHLEWNVSVVSIGKGATPSIEPALPCSVPPSEFLYPNDNWFRFESSQDGAAQLDLANEDYSSTSIYSPLAVYEGACVAGAELFCETASTSLGGVAWERSFPVKCNTTY